MRAPVAEPVAQRPPVAIAALPGRFPVALTATGSAVRYRVKALETGRLRGVVAQ